mmetsp:Transcript_10885/g.23592  ORF Transcript_10885/g.23592 Transcript_10885/m.23592 type:complete len:233 (+) Transcript_10885:1177-1875(+)
MAAQPEVNDLDHGVLILAGEEEILRLKIAVNNALLVVTVCDGIQNAQNQASGVPFREVSFFRLGLFNDAVEKFSPGAQLSDEMKILLVLVDFNQLDDVGMLTFFQQGHLAFKDIHLAHLGFSDGFDGVPNLGFSVHTLSYHSIVAVTNFFGVDVILDADVRHIVGDHNRPVHVATFVNFWVTECDCTGIHGDFNFLVRLCVWGFSSWGSRSFGSCCCFFFLRFPTAPRFARV